MGCLPRSPYDDAYVSYDDDKKERRSCDRRDTTVFFSSGGGLAGTAGAIIIYAWTEVEQQASSVPNELAGAGLSCSPGQVGCDHRHQR